MLKDKLNWQLARLICSTGQAIKFNRGNFMNDKVVSTSAVAKEEKQRLPYTSPKLKVFGQLRDLTDGGSGLVQEGMMSTNVKRHP